MAFYGWLRLLLGLELLHCVLREFDARGGFALSGAEVLEKLRVGAAMRECGELLEAAVEEALLACLAVRSQGCDAAAEPSAKAFAKTSPSSSAICTLSWSISCDLRCESLRRSSLRCSS